MEGWREEGKRKTFCCSEFFKETIVYFRGRQFNFWERTRVLAIFISVAKIHRPERCKKFNNLTMQFLTRNVGCLKKGIFFHVKHFFLLRLIDLLIFWCLTPLSAIFQLCHDDQF